ncbi:DUF998 domain-containing protein [Limimaricola soesokkakensis]|uniref:DUF998 domain-containing protein n=1 Tax=Limimaricola soesokkakensis TaxID=1343159 RepID=UPI0035156A53
MKDALGQPIDAERPYLLLLLAGLGLLGCASLVGGTIAAQIVVPGHDWIADTISDLGAGEWEIIMDVALYGFAAGLFAMALAASHAHLGGIGWSAGVVSLAILAALVVVVGARNEYGDGDSDGVVIHIYLVYGLGALFLATPLSMAAGFGRDHPWARLALIGLAIAWAVGAPLFLMAPTTIDGLAERILGLIACAILAVMAYVFWRRGLDAREGRN